MKATLALTAVFITSAMAVPKPMLTCPEPPIRRVPAEGQECPKLSVDCRLVFCKPAVVRYVPCDCALEQVVQDCPKSCCPGVEFRHFPSCHGVVGPDVPDSN